jgi:uncharacterized protein (UPF0147 family)
MEEQVIVIRIRTGEPLRVPKHILVADSLKFKEFIEELKYDEIEIEDFSPEAVNQFLAFLEQRNIGEIEDTMFRELHKLSVVFEVEWLKGSCRDWLKGKIDLAAEVEEKTYSFEESWYIFKKWEDKCMIEGLISVWAPKDNSSLIAKYLRDLNNKSDKGEIDTFLKLGGSNTDLFLRIILQNLAGQKELSENIRYLLQKMNLALCSELSEELYLDLFDTISNLPEISDTDSRLSIELMTETIRLVTSRREKRTRRTTKLYDSKKYHGVLKSFKKDMTKAVTEDHVRSIYYVVEILLYLYFYNTLNREDVEVFLEKLAHICTDKKLQKVSRQHLDVIITALKHSNRQQLDEVIHVLKEIRNDEKLSSYHENIIIKRDKRITVKKGSEYKDLYTFQHPGTGTCTESDSKCGFILRESEQDATRTLTLCTNSEDYTGTGLHYHDIISADDMYRYKVKSGSTPAGIKVTVVGHWDWWNGWLPDITDWKSEQVCIAYNITDYLVAKPE